ncbi:MAG: hypothetical protein M3348_10970 [Acidobacteriota bacterium]|nr:hypothetical protein [Acidobacteriota bacterium]
MTTGGDYNGICLTLDLDWARDEIVSPVLELMRRSGVKATFFATHRSELLSALDGEQFEVGLHPNFNQALGDFRKPIESLKEIYPQARGARSHSLFVSSHILQLYAEHGLKYESNIFLHMHEGLHPVLRFEDFVSIPFYWSDDKHISLQRPFELGDLGIESPGLKVLNFHPMHVFMNTRSDAHYESYKRHYQEPDKLKDFINRDAPGAGTLFGSLLDYLGRSGRRTYTLYEICQQYLSAGSGR